MKFQVTEHFSYGQTFETHQATGSTIRGAVQALAQSPTTALKPIHVELVTQELENGMDSSIGWSDYSVEELDQ